VPKPLRPKAPYVIVTSHAWDRFRERAVSSQIKKKTTLTILLKSRLFDRLRTEGAETLGLAVELDLGGGIRAVLRLGDMGWICTTIMEREAG
jgi:hypothetical protein